MHAPNSLGCNIALRLDTEDYALLEQIRKREKLSRAEITRRAIRLLAKTMGIAPTPEAQKVA